MRLARYVGGDGAVWVGRVDGDDVVPLAADGPGVLVEVAARRGDLDAALGPHERLDGVRLLAPIPQPPSIRDFYAFEQHVATARRSRGLDMDPGWYDRPVFYFSNPAAVFGPDDVVRHPRTQALDYELEVAAVVGVDATDLTVEEAVDAIAGYTIMNDWSARDLQRAEMAQGLGPAKGKDFATSLGPVVVTPDELPSTGPARPVARMVARVNGDEWSCGELSDLYWSFAELLAHASRDTVVRAGDVLGSGTVGTGCILELAGTHGADRYPWLQPGDVVELEVAGIGVLRNTVGEVVVR